MAMAGFAANARRGNAYRQSGSIFQIYIARKYLAKMGRRAELAIWYALNYVFVSWHTIFFRHRSFSYLAAVYYNF